MLKVSTDFQSFIPFCHGHKELRFLDLFKSNLFKYHSKELDIPCFGLFVFLLQKFNSTDIESDNRDYLADIRPYFLKSIIFPIYLKNTRKQAISSLYSLCYLFHNYLKLGSRRVSKGYTKICLNRNALEFFNKNTKHFMFIKQKWFKK